MNKVTNKPEALAIDHASRSTFADGDQTEIRFSILNETKIIRFDWDTWVLYDLKFDMSSDAMDTSRLQGGGSKSVILFTDDHRDDRRIGKVIDLDLEDRTLFATVRLGSSEWAKRFRQEIADDVEPGKSIEVFVHEYKVLKPAEYEGDGWNRKKVKNELRLATKWEVTGLSTVTTPAIGTVGFSLEEVQKIALHLERLKIVQGEEKKETMSEQSPAQITDQEALQSRLLALEAENENHKRTADALLAELAEQRRTQRLATISQFISDNNRKLPPAMSSFSASLGENSPTTLSGFMQSLNDDQLNWMFAWVNSFSVAVPETQRFVNAPVQTTNQPVDSIQLAKLAKAYITDQRNHGNIVSHLEAIEHILSTHGVK